MVLIIAEKPSLARNICAGIGEMKRQDGFPAGGDWTFVPVPAVSP